MPKINLLNTESGKVESFEPVDAREILSREGCIYSVPQESKDAIGVQAALAEVDVPQLHGSDAEMQVGVPTNKYARHDVVKAQVGSPSDVIVQPEDSTSGLTVPELKAALDAKGVSYPATAKKADLQALLGTQ